MGSQPQNPEFRNNPENQNFKLSVCFQNIKNSKFNGQIPLDKMELNQETIIFCRIQHFEADFLWKSASNS